jgi:hypothetical protein
VIPFEIPLGRRGEHFGRQNLCPNGRIKTSPVGRRIWLLTHDSSQPELHHAVWFAEKKAALKKLSKRKQTDELYEELSRAADAMIEMQQAVDEGLDCIERIAGEMEE